MARRLRQLAEACFLLPAPALGLAWLAGCIIRDRENVLVWLYFVPAPAVVLLCLLWFVFTKREVSRALRITVLALGALATCKILLLDCAWRGPAPAARPTIRAVHWNAAHAPFGFKPILRALQPDRPDLLLVSECSRRPDLDVFAARELHLPHFFEDQGMALASRYPLEVLGTVALTNGRAWTARIQTPSGPLDLAAIDLISHPTLNRRIPLESFGAWLDRRTNATPLLVLGDFNTPRDARAFRPLRRHLRHAYELAGRGWPYTWPLPVPVYAIDHAWVSRDITVHRYELEASPLSDHRRQVLDIALP